MWEGYRFLARRIPVAKSPSHKEPAYFNTHALKRQDELARRIQDKRAKAAKRSKGKKVVEIMAKDMAR